MIPSSTRIFLAIVTLMALASNDLACVNPPMPFGTWETLSAAGSTSLAGPTGLHIARNPAILAVGAFALTKLMAAKLQA